MSNAEMANAEMAKSRQAVAEALAALEAGEAMTFEGVTIVPLFAGNGHELPYALLKDAIGSGTCAVTELNEGGAVTDLKVENKGPRPVLILAGDEVVGAKQNRVIHITVIIAAMTETVIPVTCVEQGRWSYRTRRFSVGRRAHPTLRADGMKTLRRSVREGRGFRADQGRVWARVSELEESLGAASPTSAMSDSYTHVQRDLDEFRGKFARPDKAKGLAVFVNGAFVALEVFEHPDILKKVWDAEVESLAVEALSRRSAKRGGAGGKADVTECTRRICESMEKARKSVGLGYDVGIEGRGVVGAALVDEGRLVHLQAFADAVETADGGEMGY